MAITTEHGIVAGLKPPIPFTKNSFTGEAAGQFHNLGVIDREFFMDLAVRQVVAGAKAIDINLGPRKKDWAEVFTWIVEAVETVVDVPLSIDTTNVDGMEAALKTSKKNQPILNSTSAEPERLEKIPALAKKYNAKVIALTMGSSGIPVEADARVNIAVETLIPHMMEIGFNMNDLIIDPLVLTTSGCQQYCPHIIETVRMLQYAWDPAPQISVGLSNVSNAVPNDNRPLINRATQGLYTPGSTFKTVTLAAALETGRVSPTSVFSYTLRAPDAGCPPGRRALAANSSAGRCTPSTHELEPQCAQPSLSTLARVSGERVVA